MAARNYASGCDKRKLKKRKELWEKKLAGSLEKYTVRLDQCTNNEQTSDCNEPSPKKLNSENLEQNNNQNNNCSEALNPPIPKINSDNSLNIRNDCDFSNGTCVASQCFDSDPAMWISISSEMIDHFINNPPPQNMTMLNYTEKNYGDKKRSLTEAHFYYVKQNKEKVIRKWLVLSASEKKLFCWVCKLFTVSSTGQLITGFSDWKHVGVRLSEHENSAPHRQAIMQMSQRMNSSQRIDCSLVKQLEEETNYWVAVLNRVVAVVKFLSMRALPFFGNDETIGSRHNGNFLGCLELIAEFDPFLKGHLQKFGNPGKGNVNYLSSTSINEFIEIMSKEVMKEVIKEILSAKYFSVIVDSTPDITHLDQLCFVVRYVIEAQPIERFISFIPMYSHKSQDLAELILNTLHEFGIDILNCRGQSYDNASNLAGKYSGVQARIKAACPVADFVPCAAHSLNLVGVNAVEACSGAIQFFMLIKKMYNFFSASTHRWQCLNESIKDNGGNLTLKNCSTTRWCADSQAVKSMRQNYASVLSTLSALASSNQENQTTIAEAISLKKKLNKFETVLSIVIWDTLLQRLNATSIELQKPSLNLCQVVPLYESLVHFTQFVRDNFSLYEEMAKEICEKPEYEITRLKKVPKSKDPHAIDAPELHMTARQNYIRNTHYAICDSLISHLNKRKTPYQDIIEKFECILTISDSTVTKNSSQLPKSYPSDIATSFPDELQQFSSLVVNGESATEMLQKLKKLRLEDTFPNVETALRILLTLPISNCSGERSFSLLKRLKSSLRSSILQEKLSSLALLRIEGDITQKIDYSDIIAEFSKRKARKIQFN